MTLYTGDYDCDVLITDNQMPYMTGLDFIRYLKEKRRSVKNTILITGYWNEGLDLEAGKLGCDILRKPVMPEKIGAWLKAREKVA